MIHRRTRRFAAIAGTSALLALLAVPAAPASAQSDLRILMRQKLERAQQLFEAVVLARLPAVERDAAELLRLSETASWMTSPMPAYLRNAGEFQDAVRDLAAAASAGNIDQVSTAYMTMVASCVQCHREALPQALAVSPPGRASRARGREPERGTATRLCRRSPPVVHTAPQPGYNRGGNGGERRPCPHRPGRGLPCQAQNLVRFAETGGRPLLTSTRVSASRPHAGVAQLVEQLIRNQQVSGSSPLAGSNKINNLRGF